MYMYMYMYTYTYAYTYTYMYILKAGWKEEVTFIRGSVASVEREEELADPDISRASQPKVC